MARKENRAYFTENDTFATRLKEAMAFRGLNQTHLEQKILNEQGYTMQRQTISQYLRGISRPDTERLTVLCKALDVSADYLLGFSEAATNDKSLQNVCNYTGLSQQAVCELKVSGANRYIEFLLTTKAGRQFVEALAFYDEICTEKLVLSDHIETLLDEDNVLEKSVNKDSEGKNLSNFDFIFDESLAAVSVFADDSIAIRQEVGYALYKLSRAAHSLANQIHDAEAIEEMVETTANRCETFIADRLDKVVATENAAEIVEKATRENKERYFDATFDARKVFAKKRDC